MRIGLVLALCSATAFAEPFATRDQNPLLAGFGLPMPLPARLPAAGTTAIDLSLNWGSTALAQQRRAESLLVDAETREARLIVGRTLASGLALQLQVPYRYTGAGALDGLIDNWHDWFGLPEGARPALPQDQIRIVYARDGVALAERNSSSSGLADISLDLGYPIGTTSSSSATAWLNVKLPTGEADELTGSGAADVSLVLAGDHRWREHWSIFGQTGITRLGRGDLLPEQQRDVVWSAVAGLAWQASRQLDLKLQLDAHQAVFERSRLDFFADALVLTVGGAYRFQSGWQLDVAVSEDIAVETAPDVVLVMRISRKR